MKVPIHDHIVCRVISLGANPDVVKRLSQMGILPGTEMTIVRVGPLGDPVELAVASGQNIALRSQEFHSLNCEVVAIPLSAASRGSVIYAIRELQGGLGFQQKMNDRGLFVGVRLNRVEGYPYRIRIVPEGPYLTIGRGEAHKLLLEPVEDHADQP
jgi:ferrous iron transport protein A